MHLVCVCLCAVPAPVGHQECSPCYEVQLKWDFDFDARRKNKYLIKIRIWRWLHRGSFRLTHEIDFSIVSQTRLPHACEWVFCTLDRERQQL